MPFIGNKWKSETATATSDSLDVASTLDELSSSQLSKTAKRFSFSTTPPFRGSSRSQKYRKEGTVGDCPKGQDFYDCQSTGFKGCCSKNACDPKIVCPENKESEIAASKDTSSKSVANSNPNTASIALTKGSTAPDTTAGSKVGRRETLTVNSAITSYTGKHSHATMNAAFIRATEDITLAPTCPGGNGTRYSDTTNIAYTVRCNYDSTATSYNTVQVSTGGYAQCFSSCSESGDCGGFTYVGLNDGICYLKSRMLRRQYVAKEGNNYISCNKIDYQASATNSTSSATGSETPTSTPTTTATPAASAKKPNVGAIAGGAIGGIAILALMLFLIAYLARRHRKQVESKRATITHIFGGAMEPRRREEDNSTNVIPLHTRNGSTSHDYSPFAAFGGYQRTTGGGSSVARDYANHSPVASPSSNKSRPPMYPDTMPYHPVDDVKMPSPGPYMLPPTTYQPPNRPTSEQVPMLDSTPISGGNNTHRSPRFHEHISEMADTSSPPPPLTPNTAKKRWGSVRYADEKVPDFSSPQVTPDLSGNAGRMDEARKRQEQLHLMSWNNYDEGRVAEVQGNGAGGVAATIGREKARPVGRGLERTGSGISPDKTDSPVDPRFAISP